jgi:hypothetical protein
MQIPDLEHWKSHEHESWRKSRKILGILVLDDASTHETLEDSSRTLSELVGIIPILHWYCNIMMKTSSEGDFYKKLARFQELVFVSLCAVALKNVDAARVYEVMRSYSGSTAQERHLRKLVRGAIWANRSIFALSKTRWGSKCSEVFFVGKLAYFNVQICPRTNS